MFVATSIENIYGSGLNSNSLSRQFLYLKMSLVSFRFPSFLAKLYALDEIPLSLVSQSKK
jgi:hypothetical protein